MEGEKDRPFPLNPVVVDWVDSMAAFGWMGEREGQEADMRCCSIGHLVGEDDDGVVLALSRNSYQHGHYLKIPHCSVRQIVYLESADGRPE